MPATTPKHKSGFTLGVVLGAVVGTGAMMLSNSKEGKKAIKNLETSLKQGLQDLKTKYPEQTDGFEEAIHLAMTEARKATQEIQTLSKNATISTKAKEKAMETATKVAQSKPVKRLFSRSGKTLDPNS